MQVKQSTYLKGGLILIGVALFISLISVSGIFGFWLTVGTLSAGGLILLFSLISQVKKSRKKLYAKDFSLRFMATFMGFLLILGTLLYLYVFYTIGHDPMLTQELGHPVEFSNPEYLFRSFICSLDLFMLDVDTNILDRLDGHAGLKGWLAIEAIISFACTVSVLAGMVYSRLHAYYRLNYATKIDNNRNHLYLFFGNSEPSEILIKDIVKNDPMAVAIIIDEANIEEDDDDGMEGIIGLITHKQKVFRTAEKIGAHVAVASQRLDEIDEEVTSREDFDAFEYLGLSKIKKFIRRLYATDSPQLHIFFMGEDEELNIRNIITLAKDTTIMSAARNKYLYHRIYCHARYNGPNRVVENVALKKHLNINIVDSSHIAVEWLKIDPQCHPVNVVKTSKKDLATVESPLKALIVGFGEIGRDAFKFLYEFGAFVDAKDPNRRSPFECVIVDKYLDDIKGTFMSAMPGIFKYDNDAGKYEENTIRFEAVDYHSQEFYTSVILKDNFLQTVNYIIISIGNNDEAISLATRLFSLIRRKREDVSDLRIFVRCTDSNKVEGIQKIADHYNYGYGEGEKNVPVIQIFGQPEKTYTYNMVVSDRLIEEGKLFHEKNRMLTGEGNTWDERHKQLTETGTPNIEKLRKLRRQESQDRANALHAGTKMILLQKAMEDLAMEEATPIDWSKFYQRYFNADGSVNVTGAQTQIYYPGLSTRENEIIFHLAQLEHLRWNAAHELMGYEFNDSGTSCDERTMRHNCLCPWNKLDEQSDMQKGWACDYKKYDFCVVDTTIALYKDKADRTSGDED